MILNIIMIRQNNAHGVTLKNATTSYMAVKVCKLYNYNSQPLAAM